MPEKVASSSPAIEQTLRLPLFCHLPGETSCQSCKQAPFPSQFINDPSSNKTRSSAECHHSSFWIPGQGLSMTPFVADGPRTKRERRKNDTEASSSSQGHLVMKTGTVPKAHYIYLPTEPYVHAPSCCRLEKGFISLGIYKRKELEKKRKNRSTPLR